MDRACGVLLPIFSLPSKYGIGCFSKEAYEFVDFLADGGQTYWQILPLGPTSYGDSPYQSFSTFAGNPYFIDLEELIKRGWIEKELCESIDWGSTDGKNGSDYVDYEKIFKNRFTVLRKAYEKSHIVRNKKYRKFVKQNKAWLDNYALYMAVKEAHNLVSYLEWEEDIRLRTKEAVKMWTKKLKSEIGFYKFIQFMFYSQWMELKDYANKKGIKIVGDIPIYVSLDSADTWANPELFQLDEKGYPLRVAGCPPDYFAEDGQLWGNPLYDWKANKRTGYKWWIERFTKSFELYDVVRIDHFRGFDEYYSIPYGEETARNGEWVKGPGYDLFKKVKKKLGNKPVIAEDLGFITDSVRELIKECGYPGMKIMTYGFDPEDDSEHTPYTYDKNIVIYTGTHDNDTINEYFHNIMSEENREYVKKYMNFTDDDDANIEYIRCGMASVADTAIFPIQDYLGLMNEAKINTPATLGNNWKWRLIPGKLTKELQSKMKEMAEIYHRAPRTSKKEKAGKDDEKKSKK
ncbi:MAG: 4-alpha-glucanotransferase [Lachnospiraceae bacterium]|nr:4-alpha-glucanotransferase [Lachnospiraceae bacterium]